MPAATPAFTPISVQPSLARPADPASKAGWRTVWPGGSLASVLLYLPLLSTTLLAKLSVPPFAAQSLSIAYLFIFLAIGLGVAFGYLQADTRRLGFFLLFIGFIGALQLFHAAPFSLASLLLLGTLHLGYVFCLSHGAVSTARALAFFLGLASGLALLGIGQYALQFVFGARYAFPIENLLPDDFVVQGFNMQAPIAYGLEIYRANGVFFAEPSFFSQFMAVAIIVELLTSNRLLRVALYLLALLLSYSGTGLLLLAVCGPLILVTHRRRGLLWVMLLGLALLVVLGGYLEFGRLTGRIGEFGAVHSSAYARFVSGFHLFEEHLWPYPLRALFGYGAGQFLAYAARMPFSMAEMTLFKMIFEYGLLGAAVYFSFVFYCLYRSGAPFIIRLAIGLTLLLNGPFVPFFHGLALSLLVWTTPAGDGAARSPARPPLFSGGA